MKMMMMTMKNDTLYKKCCSSSIIVILWLLQLLSLLHFSVVVVTAVDTALETTTTTNTSTTLLCNGLAQLCDIPVNRVLFAAAHNGNAAFLTGYSIKPNHYFSLEQSLRAGYRSVQLDMGKCIIKGRITNERIRLIHGPCILGTRSPKRVFEHINSFLDNNPHEVLLMIIEIDFLGGTGDGRYFTLNEINEQFFETVPGFIDKLYSHPNRLEQPKSDDPKIPWPTLRELIQLNKRIVLFTYNGEPCVKTPNKDNTIANSTILNNATTTSTSLLSPETAATAVETSAASTSSTTCPLGFHDWFLYAVETEYIFWSISKLRNIPYSCNITRGLNGRQEFFGVNNFIRLANRIKQHTLNQETFVKERLQACSQYNQNREVSFLLTDFWHVGDVLQVVKEYNSQLVPVVIVPPS